MCANNTWRPMLVCSDNMCNGCMACVEKCSVSAITIEDGIDAYNAVINQQICTGCRQCMKVCPNNSSPIKHSPIMWKQGWAKNEEVRSCSSSGGLAAALSYSFVKTGGIVCSCVFRNGEFVFDFVSDAADVAKFSGSKYVKSNPKGVYKKICEYLKNDTKVLFIGLPCQVAGVKSFIGEHDLLYTVDLICHGTPSPRLLEMFLNEYGYTPALLNSITFRNKGNWYLSCDEKKVTPVSVMDKYMFAFLKSVDYTENCYSCRYASVDRISDITLGDSWGSELSDVEKKKGISIVLCQSEKGKRLLENSDLALFDVNTEITIENNKQLLKPSVKTAEREVFFTCLENRNSFKIAFSKAYPKIAFRLWLKELLVKSGILK